MKNAEEQIKKTLGNKADRSETAEMSPESTAGMSDQMSSCNSDYAPSNNSGNSSSGAYTDE